MHIEGLYMSLFGALDTILVVFKVLSTLMHHDTDTTHKNTTLSLFTDNNCRVISVESFGANKLSALE